MTNSDKRRKLAVYIASLFCLLSFLLLIHVGYEYKSSKTNEIIMEKAKEDALQQTDSAIRNVNNKFNSTSSLAEGIAKDLSSGKLKDESALKERLLAEMKNNSDIYSIVVAYSPAAHEGNLYAPHFMKNGSEVVYTPITYDYTKDFEQTAWYHDALKKESTVWISPVFGIADAIYEIDCSAPFYLAEYGNGRKAAGVVSIRQSLEGMRSQVARLNLGNTGYGFIISKKGVIISYPIQKYLARNIDDLAEEDPDIHFIRKNIEEGEYWGINSFTGKSYLVIQRPIPDTDWILGLVLPQEETLVNRQTERTHSIIQVVFATFAFLFSLCLLFVFIHMYDHRGLWMLSFTFTLLCIMGIGFIWYLTINSPTLETRNSDHVVFDMEGVETVFHHANKSHTTLRIPTGLFLQSMEFLNANDVLINGYIWQNTSALGAENDFPNFNFADSRETTIEKDYVNKDKGVTGWRFTTTLRQKFDYSRYPFDREAVTIRVLPSNNYSTECLLVPDFDSYNSMIPETLPGLEHSFVLEGWTPVKTFFSYRVNSYNTNFGARNFANSNVSEFHFNIDIKRDIKASFCSDLLLITVVAVLLFAVLMITTKGESKSYFGFSSHGVLGYCTTLLFTLIIAQSSLRSRISIGNVIYIEYFYFIMYLAILAVSLNSIAFASNRSVPFVDTKDNIYVKVLYFPVITGILLGITLLNFY